jgi:HAD superfamily hydrolase (TIGR01549 family)
MVSAIFDLEGTLVRSFEMVGDITREFRSETRKKLLDLGIPEHVFQGVVTSTLMRNKAKEHVDSNFSDSERVRFETGLNQFLLGYELKWAKNSILYDDTMSVLLRLKERSVGMAIVTNTSREAADVMLAKHELSKYFDVVITRNDVAWLKPDPQGLLMAIKRLQDRNVFFIGDLPVDSEAACRAGVKSIFVKRSWPGIQFPPDFRPDYVVEALADVPGILEENCVF